MARETVQDFQPPVGYVPTMSAPMPDPTYGPTDEFTGINRAIVPFVACGDLSGYDADKSYPLVLQRGGDGDADSDLAASASAPASSATAAASATTAGTAAGAGDASATTPGFHYVAPLVMPINPPYAQYLSLRRKEKERSGGDA